jgi:hypothetical protein
MKVKRRGFIAIAGICLGLMIQINMAFAQTGRAPVKQLSAEWWQWTFSIPTPENPVLDTTGDKCAVGQHGSVWFLTSNSGEGPTKRACSVPADKLLFFAIITIGNVDMPNVCGQGAERIPVKVLRSGNADFINGVTNLLVEVDGKEVKNVRRIRSPIFAIALPEDNLFDSSCTDFGGVPAGVYSPAVADGFYVILNRLTVGTHELHFHAENPTEEFIVDVTYELTVVPVISNRS